MGCGCGGRRRVQRGLTDAQVTNLGQCQTCGPARRARAPSAARGVQFCVDGRPIAGYAIGTRACPLGRHADSRGRVRWGGILWVGVPKPQRRRIPKPLRSKLPGCGCVWRLRAIADRMVGRRDGGD